MIANAANIATRCANAKAKLSHRNRACCDHSLWLSGIQQMIGEWAVVSENDLLLLLHVEGYLRHLPEHVSPKRRGRVWLYLKGAPAITGMYVMSCAVMHNETKKRNAHDRCLHYYYY